MRQRRHVALSPALRLLVLAGRLFAQSCVSSSVQGGYHSVALNDAGEVYSWGDNGHGQLGYASYGGQPTPKLVASFQTINAYPTPIVRLSCGQHHSIALDRVRPPASHQLRTLGGLALPLARPTGWVAARK